MKKIFIILLIITFLVSATACGSEDKNKPSVNIGKPTVNLNDYVIIVDEGFDGYGSVSAVVDFDAIIEDYHNRLSNNLDSQIFGDKTPEVAAVFVFDYYEPYVLAYDNGGGGLKNGDAISFTWNTNENAIETLAKVLDVKFKYEDFTHDVSTLKALVEVDPFENFVFNTDCMWGINGKGGILREIYFYEVKIGENSTKFDLIVDDSNSGHLSNGDIVHVRLKYVESEDYYARNYGAILTRTEADLEISGYPES